MTDDLTKIVKSGKTHPYRKWMILILLCVIAVGSYLFYLNQVEPEKTTTHYVTQPLKRGEISLVITAAGNLAPTNQVVIGSELSGTAQEVNVDTNDLVKKGQALAKLETTKLTQQTERSKAGLLAAKAKVSLAKATLRESEASYARQQELHEISGGKTPSKATMENSLATVDRSRADLESAHAAVVGAEAEVRSFERDLEKTTIRSPVDGVVLSRSLEVGQTVAASFTAPILFTIAEDLKKMELIVAVAEADIGRVENGQTATFSVDAWSSRTYTATVKKVSFGAAGTATSGSSNNAPTSSGVVTYSTELEVANDDLSLRPGMTATVDISIVNKRDVWRVPNTALRFDPAAAAEIGKPDETKKTLVQQLSSRGRKWGAAAAAKPKESAVSKGPHFWALKENQLVEIPVTIGISDGLFTEVTGDGLTENMEIVVSIKPVLTP